MNILRCRNDEGGDDYSSVVRYFEVHSIFITNVFALNYLEA